MLFRSIDTGKEYAHIDGGPSNPGYFTGIADKPAGASAPSGFDSELNTAGADNGAPVMPNLNPKSNRAASMPTASRRMPA